MVDEWLRTPFTMNTHTHAHTQLQRYNQHKPHTLGCADAHTTGGFMELGENL